MIGEALEQFKNEGFYIARNLLKSDEVITVRNGIHKSFNDQLAYLGFSADGKDLFGSMRLLYDYDINRYKRLAGALWRKLEVYNLMHHPKILGLLREQFGWKDIFMPGGQVAVIMAEELKIPDGYFGFVPHQDFPSIQGSLDGVVIWLPLVDVDRYNYPLEIIPHSHHEGVLPSKENTSSTWETDTSRYTNEDYLPVEVDVGDVVFMTLFTIHRSSQRGTAGRLRIALSTRFDNADEATFIERCYPTAYKRTVQREQYFKGFPTRDQVARIFPK
ncbi:phytanoyl-CoA dioxygenase family protein [Nitrosospira multiformis]|uniref:Phytanoyl-CoA dioxygenase (PhyH) n=1 Tax=Nitrosospira multiformis TaxID=1231 RepID=A0A1I7I7Q9_9PROT|nr:phytanoyl-CoA dioxygenase family protein [Nitrosospira multiformis]SFU68931.1 Phytanoyl-CoA dioxygenase (PhyH) [Nitrosospira multiformis]